MAEVERVLSTTLSPATTQEQPPTSLRAAPADAASEYQPPHAHSGWGHLGLLALAAFGAAIGFLTGIGLYGEVRFEPLLFIFQALILGSAAYVLFDPAMELLHDRLGAARGKFPEGRKLIATAVVALATVLVSAFHHSLGETLKEELGKLADLERLFGPLRDINGFVLAITIMSCVGLIALLTTHSWALGAKAQRWRSALYGGITSLVAAIAVGSLLVWYLANRHFLHSYLWGAVVGLLALFWFFGPGLIGGMAIDKFRPHSSPTGGVLGYLLLFSAGYALSLLIAAYAFEVAFPIYKDSVDAFIWLPVVALISQNLGWALGPFFRREFCDHHLGMSGGATEKPAAERKLPPVVAFPGPRTASPLALASIDDKQTPAARAQDLLLKPKGDRMWAALALLFTLVATGFAYHAGAMRRDPEIADNIQRDIQQDSGLRKKGLNVHSAGRIVTLSGVVDDEAEHAAAVQRALSVRGVKQLIDQIQVAPATPPASTAISTPSAGPQPPAPAIDATISIGGAASQGKVGSSANGPAPHGTAANAKPEVSQKSVEAPKTAEAQKHKGLLNFLKKDKNNQAATDSKNPADAAKSPDSEKHKGLFNFLKKDKNNNGNKNPILTPNNKNVAPTPNNKNDKSNKNPKKDVNKNPAVH
jgi:hypothetical protein